VAGKYIENLYNNSPIWLQNIFVSGQGLLFRYRRANERIMRAQFEFLLKSQHWTTAQFREYQGEQLRRLLRLAFQHVPYYRDLKEKLGCEPEDFKNPEDIRRLPILEKSQVRGQEHLFLNETIDLKKCNKAFTSGTTGTPINIYQTQEAFSRRWGFVIRLRKWAGLKDPLSPRRAQFTGRNIVPPGQDPQTQVYWRRNIPGHALLFSTTHISPETVTHYAQALRDFGPVLIDGYPSALLVIVRVSRRLKIELPKPQATIVSAETLFPEHRQELEEAFHCRVHNQFAASEPSCFWGDCEYGVMHESPEYGISEIVDALGKPTPEGEPGEVLTTSFLNPVMVLVRYRLGDIAVKGSGAPCRCGRSMPRIERIEGRMDDILFVPGRGYMARVTPVFKGVPSIIEAQIIQEELDSILVLLVPDSGYDQAMEDHLFRNLRAKLGQTVNIRVEKVTQIARGPRGKFTTVISKVKHLYPDQVNLYENHI